MYLDLLLKYGLKAAFNDFLDLQALFTDKILMLG
jgi:hypothetical protein